MQKVMGELGKSMGETLQTQKEIVLASERLKGVDDNMNGEVQWSIGSFVQKYTGATQKEVTKVEEKLPSKPYLWDTRVAYKSESSDDLLHV